MTARETMSTLEKGVLAYWTVSSIWNQRPTVRGSITVHQALSQCSNVMSTCCNKSHRLMALVSHLRDDIISNAHGGTASKTEAKEA